MPGELTTVRVVKYFPCWCSMCKPQICQKCEKLANMAAVRVGNNAGPILQTEVAGILLLFLAAPKWESVVFEYCTKRKTYVI